MNIKPHEIQCILYSALTNRLSSILNWSVIWCTIPLHQMVITLVSHWQPHSCINCRWPQFSYAISGLEFLDSWYNLRTLGREKSKAVATLQIACPIFLFWQSHCHQVLNLVSILWLPQLHRFFTYHTYLQVGKVKPSTILVYLNFSNWALFWLQLRHLKSNTLLYLNPKEDLFFQCAFSIKLMEDIRTCNNVCS